MNTTEELACDSKRYARMNAAINEFIEASKDLHGLEYHIDELIFKTSRIRGTNRFSGRPKIPTSIRVQVLVRDGNQCVTCKSTENLRMDHVHPYSKGGASTLENLQTLCHSCNSKKGAK